MIDLEEVKKLAGVFSVIPLQKNKKPFFLWKDHQERRATPQEIMRWSLELNPILWGIITGLISRIVILDFDGDKGRQLIETLGFKPHVRTGSGGFHCYFRHPGWKVKTLNSDTKKEMGLKWPGLDIRADGGYAAFTGHNEKGGYEILRPLTEPDELSLIPADLQEFLGLDHAPVAERKETGKTIPADGRVKPGILVRKALAMVCHGEGRNNAGFWLAAQLRDNGYDEGETVGIGISEYVSCLPPLNARGDPEPYTDREWRASVSQAFTKPPREPWDRRERVHPTPGSSGNGRQPGDDDDVAEERRDKFQFLTTAEILELPPPEWVIKGILPSQAIACMYGAPGAGKSFVVLDMLMSVACGLPWQDQMEAKHGIGIYIVGEGVSGISRRLAAWKSKFKTDPENHPTRRLYISLQMPHFLNGDLAELMKPIARLPESPRLIVIDTLARCMAGGDENSAKDMGRLIENCEYLRAKTGSTVLLVHHTGKGGDIRGSSALMGAIETCLAVSNDNGIVTIRCDKQKDSDPFPEITCKLLPVLVHKAEEGDLNQDNVTSCITCPIFPSKNRFSQGVLGLLFDKLSQSSLNDGLTKTEWMEISGISRSSFYRSVKELVEKGYVRVVGTGHGKRFIPIK